MASILSPTKKTTKFIIQLKEIIKHKDILFYTWKFFMKMVQTQKTGNHVFMLNALELLEIIKVPKNKSQEPESETLHLKNGVHSTFLKMILKDVFNLLLKSVFGSPTFAMLDSRHCFTSLMA